MDWPQVIGIACWCFIFGLIVGEKIATRGDRAVLDYMRPRIKVIEQHRFFAGEGSSHWSTWIVDAHRYRLTLQREEDAAKLDKILDRLAKLGGEEA